jgi:hypothetical protein
VRISAVLDRDAKQNVALVVSNRASDSIQSVTLGRGARPELHVGPEAIPAKMSGPPGWEARHVFDEESEFMRWVWTATDKQSMVPPGEMRSGFDVVLPPPKPSRTQTYYPDGTPAKPLELNGMPFRVRLAGGRCLWGRVHVLEVISGAAARSKKEEQRQNAAALP